jgi:hypothetical protein
MTKTNIVNTLDKIMINDDPEYCQNRDGSNRCKFNVYDFQAEKMICQIFDGVELFELDLPDEPDGLGCIKCDQCKESWSKIKHGAVK